jgi:hypothetical protein
VKKFRVIDTDTHLVEPPDLWTSRMSSRWGDLVPHAGWDEAFQEEAWFIGDQRVAPVASAAQAGWPDYQTEWSSVAPHRLVPAPAQRRLCATCRRWSGPLSGTLT